MLPLKITRPKFPSPCDLIISSIINFDHFSKPENGLKRKPFANRLIWILLDVVGPVLAGWGVTSIIPAAWTVHFPKGSIYLYTVEILKLISTFQGNSKVLSHHFSIWHRCYRKLRGRQKRFSSLPPKRIHSRRKLKLSKKGMGWGLSFWRMWKRPDPESEWILRDWQRGGVTGSRGAWTQMPSCRPWPEEKTSQRGQATVLSAIQGMIIAALQSRGKFSVTKLAWTDWKPQLPFVNKWSRLGYLWSLHLTPVIAEAIRTISYNDRRFLIGKCPPSYHGDKKEVGWHFYFFFI